MALLVGKTHACLGVVMISGGSDNSGTAPWLAAASATPPSRIYGLAHDDDGMGRAKAVSETMVRVLQLSGSSYMDSDCCRGAFLHSEDASFTCINLLSCSTSPLSPHLAPLDKKFAPAWTYTLTRQFNAVATPNISGSDGDSDGNGKVDSPDTKSNGDNNLGPKGTETTSAAGTFRRGVGMSASILVALATMTATLVGS